MIWPRASLAARANEIGFFFVFRFFRGDGDITARSLARGGGKISPKNIHMISMALVSEATAAGEYTKYHDGP